MIVKIQPAGKSFSGLATYLTHDPDQAKTAERVAWTHTHNLASDDVPCAVNEMLWTARDAELLKQEAGVRAGGRATESPVKHISLNWARGENPTREHMIETSQDFLRHMNWQAHQAIVIGHNDKDHAHAHLMINGVHPETGLKLDDGFERRRAQEWALQYEREHGIHCEERLKSAQERERNPPRNIWMAFQQNEREFARSEKSLENNPPIFVDEPKNLRNSEWRILKEFQRDERVEFFAQGKLEFSELRKSVYRTLREEFRERWSDYYAAEKNGTDPETLATRKAGIVAEQKAVLDARRDEACKELRASRDGQYRALLDDQREARAELRWRQEVGLDNAMFLNQLTAERGVAASFREAARDVTSPSRSSEVFGRSWEGRDDATTTDRDNGAGLGSGVKSGLISFFDSLGYDLVNLGSARPVPAPQTDSSGRRFIDVAAEEATKQRQQRERDDYDEEWRRKQRSPHGD